jgi:SAM-dependent methyltransferase
MLLVPEIELFANSLRGRSILDAGCGPGRDSRYFLGKGFVVTGIDITKRFIDLAKQRAPGGEFHVMNILDVTLGDRSFHGIWCCAVLSHLKKVDLPRALNEFYRVLESGGVLFASVKAGSGEKMVREALFDSKPRFTSFFRREEIIASLSSVGFSVLDAYEFNEKERFGQDYRDLEYIVTLSTKAE